MSKMYDACVNFILVALPGTGKTTAFRAIQACLARNNITMDILITDDAIKQRLSREDAVIQAFLKDFSSVAASIFDQTDITTTIMKTHGEELWRELEGRFVTDILHSLHHPREQAPSRPAVALDIGGKVFLRESTRRAFREHRMIPVLLYADEDTIASHLASNHQWAARSNYRLAEAESLEYAGHKGWRALAVQHREQRFRDMRDLTHICIDVSQGTPQDIAKEVLYRVKEFQLLHEQKASYGRI